MENHPAFLFIIIESNLNQEYFPNQLSLKVLLISPPNIAWPNITFISLIIMFKNIL